MKFIYGKLKMSWLTVIVFAVAAGCYTGWIMTVDCLKGTSFQDIGIFFEWWVIFAVIIVVNCKKSWEAMLKCFLFFLISQPLVFFVEFLLGHINPDMAIYYYTTNWLPKTFLTLPGGFIAYFCKKESVTGAIVLGIGNTILLLMGVYYTSQAIKSFPMHLISAVVCYAAVLIMSFSIQKTRRYRTIALLLPVILALIAAVAFRMMGRVFI